MRIGHTNQNDNDDQIVAFLSMPDLQIFWCVRLIPTKHDESRRVGGI
jgi:hypothetical protein